MRLCLIRHARTAWNEEGRIQGRTDIPLSIRGRSEVGHWRMPPGFETAPCLSSPLRRARETAELLGFAEPVLAPELVEMRWGEYEGHRLAELRERFGPTFLEAERRGIDFRPPGGESPREVAGRLHGLLGELAHRECDHVAVGHKGILRAALVLSLGWDMTGEPPVTYEPERAMLLELKPGRAPLFIDSIALRPEEA